MKAALETGANFWNGGEFYSIPNNNFLHFLHDYFILYLEDVIKVILSIKGGVMPGYFLLKGDKEGITRSIEECLKVLDSKNKINIFKCACVDPKVRLKKQLDILLNS
jgi:pyridoxine 4-dehydrogenase